MKKLLFTLRRTRGAIGSYQGPSGALYTAPNVSPTPTDGSDGFPGEGKGLTLSSRELKWVTRIRLNVGGYCSSPIARMIADPM